MNRVLHNYGLIDQESDSSDFENEMAEFNVAIRKEKIFRERKNYFELLDEVEFQKRFRLKKRTVKMILEELQDQIKYPTNRNNAISSMTQLLLTLRFFATGNFLITAGDFSGVSVAAAGQIVKRVSYALATKSDKYIKMPKTTAEIMELKVKFYGLARFPKVIGAIDCTHIKLQSPSREYGEQYRNRKGLRARMELHEFKDCVILGDAGYALSHYLLTPIANPTTKAERLYNESQIRTRNVVERTFGVWKRRFPVLFFGLRLKMETSMAVIQSCAILHNIARLANDPQPPDEVENITDLLTNELVDIEDVIQPEHNNCGLRNALIAEHFGLM
ncbi:unnamed protein product [Macrosiphum euphorbiae]|uniref:DDE Tnp4 domain-containing protein n=1 Tax=Macrosiphum euphorbiae TaxID=13131 RepID=A0AAV0XN26_9HEMI|nr:unnamed protein product [Macrosiphum euphorbiae]